MREVGHQQQYVYDHNVYQSELILDSPPVAEGEEKQRHTEDEVIEPHVKQVVVSIHKSKQPKDHISLGNAVEEIEEGERQETDTEGKYYLFTNKWWKDVQQDDKEARGMSNSGR